MGAEWCSLTLLHHHCWLPVPTTVTNFSSPGTNLGMIQVLLRFNGVFSTTHLSRDFPHLLLISPRNKQGVRSPVGSAQSVPWSEGMWTSPRPQLSKGELQQFPKLITTPAVLIWALTREKIPPSASLALGRSLKPSRTLITRCCWEKDQRSNKHRLLFLEARALWGVTALLPPV